MENKLSRLDLARAQSVLGRIPFNSEFHPGVWTDVLEGIGKLGAGASIGITTGQLEKLESVIALAQKEGLINPESAESALEEITRQKTLATPARLTSTQLKLPIEVVVQNARKELEGYLTADSTQIEDVPDLTVLEKAIIKLEILDGWIDINTWLGQFIQRSNKSIDIYPLTLRESLRVHLAGGDHIELKSDESSNIIRLSSRWVKLTPQMLEHCWDRNTYRDLINSLASAKSEQLINKILRSVK